MYQIKCGHIAIKKSYIFISFEYSIIKIQLLYYFEYNLQRCFIPFNSILTSYKWNCHLKRNQIFWLLFLSASLDLFWNHLHLADSIVSLRSWKEIFFATINSFWIYFLFQQYVGRITQPLFENSIIRLNNNEPLKIDCSFIHGFNIMHFSKKMMCILPFHLTTQKVNYY